ncbi:MAG: ABC transporter substrate-binding protein [Nitriliruptoraceae bacterium]
MVRSLGLVAIIFTLVACAAEPLPEVPVNAPAPAGAILRVALENNPLSIDPRFVRDDEGEQIVDALFDPLVRLDGGFRIVPAAAESWDIDDTGLRYTFTLRKATFHDGSPVTAQDFVRAFNGITDGTSTPRSYLEYLLRDVAGITNAQRFGTPLSGVRALDPQTLEITLRRPRAAFLELLTDPSLAPIPAAAENDPESFALAPIGNGPFQMVGVYEPGAFIRLARNTDHHMPPQIDEVIFTIFANDPTREAQWRAFTDGQIHVAYVPPQRRSEAIRRFGMVAGGDRSHGVVTDLTSAVYLYVIDVQTPPFTDVRARQALSLAIDRELLAAEVMGGTRVAATSYLPPSLPGALTSPCSHCTPDSARARELFADAVAATEADPDLILNLLHPLGAVHTLIAERLASMIEQSLPITVRFRAIDYSTLANQQEQFAWSAFRLGWRSNVTDAAEYLEPLFGGSLADGDSLLGQDESVFDEPLILNRGIKSALIRQFLYQQLERELLEEAIVLPILWYRHERIIATDLADAHISPFGRLNLSEISMQTSS